MFVIHCDIFSRSRNYFIVEIPDGLSSDKFVAFNEFGAAVSHVLQYSVSEFMLHVFVKDRSSNTFRELFLKVILA